MPSLLHTHSEYSWDSPLKPKLGALAALHLGYKAYALTNHGTTSGLVEHEKACEEVGIKPLLGCEVYYQNDYDESLPRTHLTVIARDSKGLENLYQLQSEAARNFYHVPVVTGDSLVKFSEGLIILSGCVSSLASRYILDDKLDEFQNFIEGLRSVADPGCFFLELQPFSVFNSDGVDLQKKVNTVLLQARKQLGFPIVMTGDSHFVEKDEIDAYQVSLKIARNKADSMSDYSCRYIQSTDDMWKAWEGMMTNMPHDTMEGAFKEAIMNTDVVADMCEATTFKKPQLPVLKLPKKSSEVLVERVVSGMKEKGIWGVVEYNQRAKYELERIISKKFCDYILMVHDEFLWYQSQNMPATIRGSAAGSLVCFALGLTRVDPLKLVDVEKGVNDLHVTFGFDRFLGEDRTDLPDIDIDVADRDAAVNHFQEKFPNQTALVSAFGRWQSKNLANKLETAFPLDKQDAALLKSVLGDLHIDQGSSLKVLDICKEVQALELKYPGLTDTIKLLHNTINYTGTHASAVVVTKEPIETQLSLISVVKPDKTRVLQACYGKDDLELIGGVKVDFLGNDGLEAIKIAEEDANVSFDESWLSDSDMLQGFIDGDTAGINQFEKRDATSMIKQVAKGLGNFEFSDLVAINAINRPGAAPLSDYIKGDNNSIVAPFCQDSRGAMIYQEQAVKLLRYAGFSWIEVTLFLKANKKKIKSPDLRHAFVAGMKRYGHDVGELHQVFDGLEGRYFFNKSHAASYALMAAEQMYLKNGNKATNAKGEKAKNGPYVFSWFLGLLSSEGNLRKRRVYTSDAAQHGVFVVPPHINGLARYRKILVKINGKEKFCIQEGLEHLEGIGKTTAHLIEQERLTNGDYTSEQDFIDRFKNKRVEAKENGEKFKSPASSATLETLRTFGCLEFDLSIKAKQILDYNREKMRQVVFIP